MTLNQGQKYDVTALKFSGWTGNDEIYDEQGNRNPGMDGYSVGDYFGADGAYKGADINGVEPTFEPAALGERPRSVAPGSTGAQGTKKMTYRDATYATIERSLGDSACADCRECRSVGYDHPECTLLGARDAMHERECYQWASREQGFVGGYADWLALPTDEREQYELSAAGIPTS